ncbi:hypothetical protein [Microbaculum marinisediminis]|uniref:Uncharacterized protein n=1 Tax=Microbaculum marinisediminis TaxID=2931392 RepID=A0AAW5QVS2_9HYPH|nr:hypothetical protein [Microbaculum sp. A6E488]MCT8972156.1 hypothetical protein [Microbaculum sp. A6E488]
MNSKSRETQIAELNGALEVLFELREEFAQWAEEGEDDSKREALENVLGHVEVMEAEYKRRRDELVG